MFKSAFLKRLRFAPESRNARFGRLYPVAIIAHHCLACAPRSVRDNVFPGPKATALSTSRFCSEATVVITNANAPKVCHALATIPIVAANV